MLVEHGRGVDGIRGRAPSPGRVRVPALWPDGALQLRGAEAPQHPFRCPPGGELRHEGPLLTGQGQVPGPRCTVQRVQQAGECSLFYSKRFCLPCVRENLGVFPAEIRQDLEKRKTPSSTRPSGRACPRT
ncbi:cysteine-rich DPF motif domain-containing protein 1 isoform X3 [Octodon degus]|uniref:Cysteine-rich DPF motif domain-containing protein 1 n=1 Tax=Octodon degus TaxID=10160 RepID=A0A6P6DE34_OCTDE|nr:cysteine-rich DPF motif domain-containing protein 1 isoform X3 [Octodon degus]